MPGGILILTGGGHSTPLVAFADDMREELSDMSDILREVAEEIVQPAFGAHFDQAGLHNRSGLFKTALTKTGSRGNILEIRPLGFSAGVDFAEVPEALFIIGGTGQKTGGRIYPKKAKVLSWIDPDTGKRLFAKSVRGISPHPDIVALTEAEFSAVADNVSRKLVERGCIPLRR